MASGIFKKCHQYRTLSGMRRDGLVQLISQKGRGRLFVIMQEACRDGYGSSDVAGKDGRMYCFISEKNNQYIYGECQADRGHFKENREKPKERFRYVGKVRPAGDTTLDCVYRTILKNCIWRTGTGNTCMGKDGATA